ncbi:MAG: hypothetical protein NTW28_16585 [Candidatus Solibacter sp.]|nr:hypothetical protein [Candidatus Solibacter sp.]
MTYNGTSLAKVNAASRGNAYLAAWCLRAPTSGTHSVVVTLTSDYVTAGSISYSGADQSACTSQNATNTGSNNAATNTIVPPDAGSTLAAGYYWGANALTLAGGTTDTWTIRLRNDDGPNGQSYAITELASATGSQTDLWHTDASAPYATVAVALKPAGAATTVRRRVVIQ